MIPTKSLHCIRRILGLYFFPNESNLAPKSDLCPRAGLQANELTCEQPQSSLSSALDFRNAGLGMFEAECASLIRVAPHHYPPTSGFLHVDASCSRVAGWAHSEGCNAITPVSCHDPVGNTVSVGETSHSPPQQAADIAHKCQHTEIEKL